MHAFVTHFQNILAIDWATIAFIAFLCFCASYFTKEFLAHPPLIIFIFPIMVYCGMVAYYVFVTTEQFAPKKIDQWVMWTILSAICGTVIGIGSVGGVAVLREKIGARPPPPTKPARASR